MSKVKLQSILINNNKYLKLGIVLIYCISNVSLVWAQSDTINNLRLSTYAEIYCSYDLDPGNAIQNSPFLFNHKRNKEISCNLLLVKANYQRKRFRANIGLMSGDYARYNLSGEPAWARYINEVNLGVKLSKNKNLWFDLGVLPSHIGFESAIGLDCWTLTRSLLAENSPYYESGLRLSYTTYNEKFFASALVLNGWQRIAYNPKNDIPAVGTQITWKPNNSFTINYSSFIGNVRIDSLPTFRHFHNLYALLSLSAKTGLIVGFDIGQQSSSKGNLLWYSPVMMLRQDLSKKTNLCLRAEYYSDQQGVMLNTDQTSGAAIAGFSGTFHYQINEHAALRFEGKTFQANKPVFFNHASNVSLTTAFMINF